MDSHLIQRTRYQLQARIRSTKACPNTLFFMMCGHLLEWIESHPFLRALLAPLEAQCSADVRRLSAFIEACVRQEDDEERADLSTWSPRDREAAAALSLSVLRVVRELDPERGAYPAYVAAYVAAGLRKQGLDETVEALRDVCVTAVYDYLDESIDSRNAVLGLMLKYKHRCEMYRRRRLREAATNGIEGRQKERALAFDFYEYLHDQGVDFWVESVSASGEPDIVSREAGGYPLVADAKYVDEPAKARRAISNPSLNCVP